VTWFFNTNQSAGQPSIATEVLHSPLLKYV